MTIMMTRPESGPPAAPQGSGPSGPASSGPSPQWRERVALDPTFVPSTVLVIVAALTLTFVVTIAVLGPVRHARDQQTAFATLRGELANATAMVNQVDDKGQPQPLGRPMAVLDIPQIGVREVVLEGTTSGVLRAGPGHRRDTPLPGQAGTSVIFGRQAGYGGPFGHLDQLVRGSVFSVTTGQGRRLFRVVAVRRAGDPQAPVLAAGKGRVTLITAAGQRFVPEGVLRVDADLVGDVAEAGPRPIGAAALPAAETALAGDPSVWVAILLLTQGMLLVCLTVSWARTRWGRAQVWLTGMPVVFAFAVALSDTFACLLPNLL